MISLHHFNPFTPNFHWHIGALCLNCYSLLTKLAIETTSLHNGLTEHLSINRDMMFLSLGSHKRQFYGIIPLFLKYQNIRYGNIVISLQLHKYCGNTLGNRDRHRVFMSVCSLTSEVTLPCGAALPSNQFQCSWRWRWWWCKSSLLPLHHVVFCPLQLVDAAGLIALSQNTLSSCEWTANLRGYPHKLCWTFPCLHFTLSCLARHFSNPHKLI